MNQEFPGQHTTTVTTRQTVTNPSIRWDPFFLRSVPGIVKGSIVVLSLLSLIFVVVAIPSTHTSFNNFVASTSFWFMGFILVFYLFHIVEKFSSIPWSIIELGFSAIWTILFAVVSSLVISRAHADVCFAIGAFFGYCAMVACGINAWLSFVTWKSGGLAQGQRTHTSKQVTVMNSAA